MSFSDLPHMTSGVGANEVYRFFADKLFIPIILGLLVALWKIGWREWRERKERLDTIEEKLQDLEGAVNGGEQADGIQAEVHEIKRMLKQTDE
jgi:hypothetical protein